jgi:hypothetical protein
MSENSEALERAYDAFNSGDTDRVSEQIPSGVERHER